MMKEWNLLVATYWGKGKRSLHFLNQHGEFKSSGFKDVLLGHVEDVQLFLDKMELMRQENPGRVDFISRIVPLERTFHFDLFEFMDQLKASLSPYVGKVADKKFYVRAKRRGHKGEISSHAIEKEIAEFIVENLEKTGKQPHVSFSDPDVIIVVETIGNWAAVTSITKEMKEKYPLLKIK